VHRDTYATELHISNYFHISHRIVKSPIKPFLPFCSMIKQARRWLLIRRNRLHLPIATHFSAFFSVRLCRLSRLSILLKPLDRVRCHVAGTGSSDTLQCQMGVHGLQRKKFGVQTAALKMEDWSMEDQITEKSKQCHKNG